MGVAFAHFVFAKSKQASKQKHSLHFQSKHHFGMTIQDPNVIFKAYCKKTSKDPHPEGKAALPAHHAECSPNQAELWSPETLGFSTSSPLRQRVVPISALPGSALNSPQSSRISLYWGTCVFSLGFSSSSASPRGRVYLRTHSRCLDSFRTSFILGDFFSKTYFSQLIH